MKTLQMQLPAQPAKAYSISIATHLLQNPEHWLDNEWNNKRLVILTDDHVKTLYAESLFNQLKKFNPLLFSFTPGEESKSAHTKQILEKQMLQHHCNRNTLVLAVGGGVVGDLAGFVASTYMRGIPYIQIPTTLLAMVDSSVGGKTAINTPQGKNLIGAFWQPASVIVDINCIKTLSTAQLINGLIEALKMFMTNDIESFNFANQHLDNILQKDLHITENIVARAIQIKVAIVSADEKENNERMILNFGHTIGHALEKITDYAMPHGTAVALGILVESKISELKGFLSLSEYQTIKLILSKLNMTSDQLKQFDADAMIEATKIDKKTKENQVRYVLLKQIGQVCQNENAFVHTVSDDLVKQAIHEVCEVNNGR